MIFESNTLIPDLWLGVISWEGRPIAPPFSAAAPRTGKALECKSTIHIIVGSTPIGAIDFDTLIDPSIENASGLVRLASRALRAAQLNSNGKELVVDLQGSAAFRYRSAFLSYARKDLHRVSYFAQGLEEAGIKVRADVNAFRLGETWNSQARALIAECDAFYLCWSTSASESEAVRQELEYARKLAREIGRLKIIPIFIDDKVIKLPPGFEQHNALTLWNRMRVAYLQEA